MKLMGSSSIGLGLDDYGILLGNSY